MLQSRLAGIFLIFIFHAITMFLLCPSRFSRMKTICVWIQMVLFSTLVSWFIMQKIPNLTGALAALSISLVSFSVTVLYLSQKSVAKTLFLFLTYLQMFMVSLFLSGFLSYHIFNNSASIAILIRSILQLGIVVLCITLYPEFNTVLLAITKGWWPLNFLALLLLAYLSALILHSYIDFSNHTESVFVFLLMVVLIAVYLVFFYTIQYMYTAARSRQTQIQSEYLLREVEEMQGHIEEARRIRHDARHHNLNIAEFARKKDYNALLQYLDEYEQEAEQSMPNKLCSHVTVNNILTAYSRKAAKMGIALHMDVEIERKIAIKDIDLVAILANLMENAVNGCSRSGQPSPKIDLHIGRKGDKLTIKISNSCAADLQIENGLPCAQGKEGVGIQSILHSAKRYGGEIDFQMKDGFFICRALLKVLNKESC